MEPATSNYNATDQFHYAFPPPGGAQLNHNINSSRSQFGLRQIMIKDSPPPPHLTLPHPHRTRPHPHPHPHPHDSPPPLIICDQRFSNNNNNNNHLINYLQNMSTSTSPTPTPADDQIQGYFNTQIVQPISSLSSNSTTSDEADDDQQQQLIISILNERKQRRMTSNRESARRSRMRKQKQLDELWAQVVSLRNENHQLIDKLNHASQYNDKVVEENAQLKQEASQLRHQMLIDIDMKLINTPAANSPPIISFGGDLDEYFPGDTKTYLIWNS